MRSAVSTRRGCLRRIAISCPVRDFLMLHGLKALDYCSYINAVAHRCKGAKQQAQLQGGLLHNSITSRSRMRQSRSARSASLRRRPAARSAGQAASRLLLRPPFFGDLFPGPPAHAAPDPMTLRAVQRRHVPRNRECLRMADVFVPPSVQRTAAPPPVLPDGPVWPIASSRRTSRRSDAWPPSLPGAGNSPAHTRRHNEVRNRPNQSVSCGFLT